VEIRELKLSVSLALCTSFCTSMTFGCWANASAAALSRIRRYVIPPSIWFSPGALSHMSRTSCQKSVIELKIFKSDMIDEGADEAEANKIRGADYTARRVHMRASFCIRMHLLD
jgi:hypothetical protein